MVEIHRSIKVWVQKMGDKSGVYLGIFRGGEPTLLAPATMHVELMLIERT